MNMTAPATSTSIIELLPGTEATIIGALNGTAPQRMLINVELSETTAVTRYGPSKLLRLTVAGEIDDSRAPTLRAAITSAAVKNSDRLELDLTGVTFSRAPVSRSRSGHSRPPRAVSI